MQPLALEVALLALVALATLAAALAALALAVIQGRALMLGLAQQALLVARPLPAPRLSPPQGP